MTGSVDQASADNAGVVGLMAESFAKKGWEFALKQDQGVTTINPHRSHTVFPTTERSYSTLAPCMTFAGGRDCSGSRSLLCTAAVGEVPVALMTRDIVNFPPRLKELRNRLLDFMEEVVYPAERTLMDHQTSHDRWVPHQLVEDMKVHL